MLWGVVRFGRPLGNEGSRDFFQCIGFAKSKESDKPKKGHGEGATQPPPPTGHIWPSVGNSRNND